MFLNRPKCRFKSATWRENPFTAFLQNNLISKETLSESCWSEYWQNIFGSIFLFHFDSIRQLIPLKNYHTQDGKGHRSKTCGGLLHENFQFKLPMRVSAPVMIETCSSVYLFLFPITLVIVHHRLWRTFQCPE